MTSFRVSIAYYDLPKLEYACNDLCSAAKEYFVLNKMNIDDLLNNMIYCNLSI